MSTWFPTGDLVRIDGDRVHFVARKTDIINVGGNKVFPMDVERVLREVSGVADVRVYPAPSSLVGEVVAADVVAAPTEAQQEVQRQLTAHCVQRLQPF